MNADAPAILESDQVVALAARLVTCPDVQSALPLLEALTAACRDSLTICLPPAYDGAFFPITDWDQIHTWLVRGKNVPPPVTGGAPIFLGDRLVGRLAAPISHAALHLLAHRIGVALELWQQRVAEQRARTEKETLVRLCRAANAHHDLQAVLAEAYAALQRSIPFDSFVATVYDPATEINVLSYSVSVATGQVFVDNLLGPLPNNLLGYIVRRRQPLHFADLYNEIAAYPDIQIRHFGDDPRMRGWIGVPMLLGDGQPVGVLSIQSLTADLYSADDLQFLEQVAVPAAIAVEKAMLLQQRDREIAVLTAQTELSEALGRAHDVRTALASALTALEQSFPANAYLLYVLNAQQQIEASLVKESGVLYRDDGVGQQIAPASLSSYILRQPKPVLFNTESEMIAAGVVWNDVGDPEQPATETVIGASLHASDGSRMGLISVQTYGRNAFDLRHAALLGSIARQVALVVENARLIEQDQQRLRELERAYHELELAQHRAVEAERLRAIGDIAAGVAHDFNNLLSAILGNAQLIGLEASLGEARSMALTIETAARDAATIVRRIQEFTRSRDATERAPVDVFALLHSAVELTRPRWRDEPRLRGVTIEMRCERTPVEPILGVEAELREVLVNLIFNAVDALPAGGQIILGCRQHGDIVHIFVRDTGAGMPPNVLARAAQPFFSTKGSRGSGLGLAVSQGIVQRHGGELVIDSEAGQGTIVTLQLPVAREPLLTRSATAIHTNRTARIALVEDDPHVRLVMRRMLEQSGHAVVEFGAGPDAITHIQHHVVDLLITDLGLPGMSGWDVAAAARAAQPTVQLLLVTGWGDRIAPEDAHRSGVHAVLSKPVEQTTLLRVVAETLQRSARDEPIVPDTIRL